MKQIVYECQNVKNQQLNNYTANKILGKPTIVKTMQTVWTIQGHTRCALSKSLKER